jgi:hypothetical protein
MRLGPWQEVGRSRRFKFFADQGLATVARTDGTTFQLYRGSASVPRRLKQRSWVHIGDPDSAQGHVFDAYQGPSGATSKMFEVTTPDGRHYDFQHQLEGDELFNNSYVAVSPNGQWMIAGEWGVMSRILVFPAPVLNRSAPLPGGALARVGSIELDRPVRNVQGATFLDDTRLLCSTDDPAADLWPTPRQLLHVDLAGPLDGRSIEGRVTSLGPLPTASLCPGEAEVEGLDYDVTSGDLRVVVVPPGWCSLLVVIQRFRQV